MNKTKKPLLKIFSIVLSVVMLTAVLATLSGCGGDPLTEYTITYDLGGGTNPTENPAVFTTDDFPLVIQDPTKDGYTFLGWTSEIHEDPVYELSLLLGDEQNLTLTANWAINLSPGNIRYMLGSKAVNNPVNPDKFTEADLPLIIDGEPTREGYTFTGWLQAPDKKTKRMSVTINRFESVILTATWDKEMSADYGNGKLLAPDFSFKDRDGKIYNLSDYRGVKPVFVSFWVTSCKYCKAEIQDVFNPIYSSDFKDEFELIVICCDPHNLSSYTDKVNFTMYTAAGGVSGYTDSFWPKNYMVDKWGYLFNEDRPTDITKPPVNNFDCVTFTSVGQMKKVINGAIARANK